MVKCSFKGSEGWITYRVYKFLGETWILATSETKWHKGEKFKRTPIWFTHMVEGVPMLFIWKMGFGIDRRK